jgi:L-rhamnose mutarotase
MRIALHSVLRAGHESAYDEAHAVIPAELVESFGRLGIHDWAIWRSGRNLFHLVDCDDFAAAMAALEHDPANERWQAFIGRHVDHFEQLGGGVGGQELPLVWELSHQRDS